MEFDLDIALEFVEKVNPEPTPIEYITGQTGDVMLPVILAAIMLLLVSFGAFMFFKKRKARTNEASSATAAATKAATLMTSKWIALAVVATLITAVALFAGSIVQAQASGEGKIETPSTVKAYVDKEAGTVSFDTSWIKNNSSGDIIFDKSKVVQVEESLEICDLSNSNFKVNALGGTVFNGHPNDETPYIPTDLTALPPEETSDMTFDLTNVAATDMFNLIGHKVFNIKLWYLDSAIPVPQPNKLTYNGAVQTGVNEGIGYTLSGTTETKDAGTYTATARLISGFVWEDGSRDDKTITWKIDKLAMTITSGDAEKTYDGEKAAKEEVTEDPAFPEGEGFVYTWTSNVVNVEDTADANNTFTYDGQTGTSLNNYDVTRVYGKLTVTPRDITISSKDKTWPYDSQEHSCTAEDVELISGSWALAEEGLEYYNFASIIDYTEEGLANTFEYKANSFTEIENYNIHAQYKKIYISKVATPIIVNPKRAEKTYDGTPLTCKEYDYDKSILKGADKLQATVSGSITDFGTGTSYIEKASDVKIFRGETDATNNYTFGTHGEGILEIFKRSISLKSGSDTFTYNGQVHYCKTVSIESGSWAPNEGTEYKNFKGVTFVNGEGVENSFELEPWTNTKLSNYDIQITKGILKVVKPETDIIITPASETREYNGLPLENSGYTFTEGVLADGDTLQVTIEGSTTKANTSVENVVTKVKVTRGEEDVTFNYSFGEHEKGTLTVTKRKVTIESKSYDFDYDSSAHSYPYYDITFGSFVNGEGFDYKSWASVTDYSDEAVKNIFEVEAWVDTDKNNYDIKCEYGDLRIKKVSTPIVVTANSNSKPYDGTPLTDEGYTFTENVLKGADELTAKVEGSITDFSATPEENVVTEVKVYRKISAEEKVEVSQNYNLEQRISGKLRINKCNVTFTSGSTSWTFDGDPHYYDDVTVSVTSGAMPEGQGFDFYNFKTVTHVSEGIQDNTFAYSAKDGTNPDNYNIKIVPGTVQVVSSETPIVVKANEDSKVYDGAPLVNSGFSYTQGVLPEGFTLEASVSPEKELINVGHTYNVVDKDSIKIYDSDGKDVTGDFKLATPEKGKLEITKREITVKSNDATWDYDSWEHCCTSDDIKVVSETKFVEGEGLEYYDFAKITDHQSQPISNTYSYRAKGDTKLNNYNITREYGTLQIDVVTTSIVVKAKGATNIYDGKELTQSAWEIVQADIKSNDKLVVETAGGITDAGTQTNSVSSCTVMRGGEDVSVNYTFGEHQTGTLSITPRPIELTSANGQWNYNGEVHTSKSVEVTSELNFVEGQGIESYSDYASIKDVFENGELGKENTFNYTLKENTKAGNYNITKVFGRLKMLPVETQLVVTANSINEIYNGETWTDSGFTYNEILQSENEIVQAEISGSQKDAGSSANTVGDVKVLRDNVNITSNYKISKVNGTLVVNPLLVEYEWSSAALGIYNQQEHINSVKANIKNKVGSDSVAITLEVRDKSTMSIVTSIVDAGTYSATMKSLSGAEAGNYKLPETAPSQDYVLSKAPSSMTFTPGSISTTYSLTASQGNSFNAATDASGNVTYTITGGDTEGFSIPTASDSKINAVAKKAAKTSYSIEITAHDSGDKNHNPADKAGTLTWTINQLTVEYLWSSTDLGKYNQQDHIGDVKANVTNKDAADVVNIVLEVVDKATSSTVTSIVDAGTYTATMKSLSGAEAGNYKLPETAPSQDYVLSKAKPTLSWQGVSDDGYKLDRNDVYTDPYSFALFEGKGISLDFTNTDTGVTFTVVGSGLPTGVSVVNNNTIVIDPTTASGTIFDLSIKANSDETANYLASDVDATNIKIAISSLYWGIDEDGTLYISPFENEDATTESESTLSATSTSEIGWYSSIAKIKNVVVQETANSFKVKPVSMASWFKDATNIVSVNLDNLDASQVTSMNSTFSGCTSLASLDLSKLNTINLKNMYATFQKTTKLATLTFGDRFTTTNVTTMRALFWGTDALMVDSVPTTIVGMNESFNTSNVTTFMQAFSYHKFTFLDLTGIDTYGANETTALAQMFRGIELTDSNELDVSHFNINSNATNLSYMFASMVGVETIKFGEGFATSQATTLGYMFDGFQGRTLDLRYFKNSTNNSIKGMFNGCSNLTTIYVDSANWTDKNLSGNFAFSGCSNLVGCNEDGSVTSSWVSSHTAGTYARIPYLDESGNIKSGYFTDINAPILPGYMIDEATGTLHLSAGKEGYNPAPAIITGFDSSSDVPWLKTAAKLKYTKVVVDLDTNNQKLSPQSMAFWFLDASNITFIDLKNLNANQVTSMNSTFCGCSALTDLDLSSLDTSNVKNMSSTFAHTKSLGTLTLGGNFTTENVVDMSGLFLGDNEYVTQSSTPTKIVGMKDSFITNNVQTFSNAFRYHKFTSLDFSGFNTEAVPSDTESGIKGMFCGLYLTDSSILDISTFVVKPSSLIETFGKMVGVTSIVFGTDFDASSVTKMECAFMNFEGTTLDLTTFGSSKIAESSGLGSAFSGCSNLTTIYVDSAKWTEPEFGFRYNDTFTGCVNLVGSNVDRSVTTSHGTGTTYDSGEFARIPSADKPGLFTDKNVPPPPGYKIDEATGTLHISLGQDGYNTDQRIVTGFESASDVPWLTTEAKANYTKVVVEESAGNKKLAPQTMAYWFQGASNIVSINLDNLDASKVTSMNSTFYGCTALESLDLSNLNTIALTDMKSTFRSTDSLATLTLGGNFTTENVTTMDGLFAGVDATETKSTTATNIVGMNESFHTGNVTTFAGAFSNHKFTALDFSSFTISQNIINNGFVSMFLGLSLPEGSTLNVESFSGKIGNLTNMFGALDGVTSIKFGQGFDTSAAKTMRGAFGEFKGTTLDLSSFSNASTIYISLQSMFYNCSNLTTIYVNKDLWVNGKDYSGSPYAFAGCKNLVGCNGDGTLISEFDEDETIGDLAHIPYKDDSGIVHRGYFTDINAPGLAYWKIDSATSTLHLSATGGDGYTKESRIITGFSSKNDVPWLSKSFSKVVVDPGVSNAILSPKSMDYWFYDSNLSSFDFSNLDTSNLESLKATFYGCKSLGDVDLSQFNTVKLLNMSQIFANCTTLYSADLSGLNTSKVTDMSMMFSVDTSLNTVTFGENFSMENVEKTNNMFSGCGNLHDIDFSNFKNNKVTNTSYMFSGCSSLKTIDLSGFDTSHVTNMRNMFYGCSKLEKIYASDKFVTTSIDAEKDVNMFLDCSSVLKGGMGTTWSSDNPTDKTYARIDQGPSSASPGYFTEAKSFYKVENGTLHLSPDDEGGYIHEPRIVTGFNGAVNVPWLEDEEKVKYTKVVIDEGASNAKLTPKSMEYWFQGASNIVSINLNNLDASQVTSMKSTFKGCTALESLNLSSLKTANLKSMVSTFENTYSLGTLTLGGNFTTENVTAMDSLFVGEDAASTQSSTPTEIIGMKDSFKTENVKTIIKAFAYHKFTSLDFSGFKTINVGGTKGFASMFMGLQFESETELDVSSFETGENATILSLMFGDLVNVSSIKFGDGFTTDKATMFTGMFRNFKGKTLDLRYFNNTNVSTSGKALGQMFVGCTNLTKIIVDPEKWTDKSLTDASTFGSCFNLIGSNADGSITTSHGAGTDYDSGAYARVPSDGKPGLLTDKDAPKDSALNNNSADNNTQDDDIIDNDTDTNKDTNGGPSGLAAILGAPFAFGLMFGRRRVSEKHVKIK